MNNVTKALAALLLVTACGDDTVPPVTEVPDGGGTGGEILSACRRVDLVSDQQGAASRVDTNLVNAWGIARGDDAFVIAAEATGVVAIYDGAGRPSIETSLRSGALNLGEGITGVARTHSALFSTTSGGTQVVADYIVANEDGKLIAVSTAVVGGASQVFFDQEGAGYMGVAVLSDRITNTNLILAADFQHAKIVAFDTMLLPVQLPGARSSSTTTFQVPDLPEDFAPFNIAVLDGRIFVAYAKRELGMNEQGQPVFEEVKGVGLGLVAEFDVTGQFVRTIASGGDLNAPWGMTFAPAGFCSMGGPSNSGNTFLLVGNFGDGKLIPVELGSVVDANGLVVASLARPPLVDSAGATIAIDGLWGIIFGDNTVGLANNLYFAAGPDDEEHGLYGRIEGVTLVTN